MEMIAKTKQSKYVKAGAFALMVLFLIPSATTVTADDGSNSFEYSIEGDSRVSITTVNNRQIDPNDEDIPSPCWRASFLVCKGDYYWTYLPPQRHAYGAELIEYCIHDGNRHESNAEGYFKFTLLDGTVILNRFTWKQTWSGLSWWIIGNGIHLRLNEEYKNQLKVLEVHVTRWVDNCPPQSKTWYVYGNHGGGGGSNSMASNPLVIKTCEATTGLA